MRYAFEIKTLVMVDANSEDEAWDKVRDTARDAISDFDFERSPEDDDDEDVVAGHEGPRRLLRDPNTGSGRFVRQHPSDARPM